VLSGALGLVARRDDVGEDDRVPEDVVPLVPLVPPTEELVGCDVVVLPPFVVGGTLLVAGGCDVAVPGAEEVVAGTTGAVTPPVVLAGVVTVDGGRTASHSAKTPTHSRARTTVDVRARPRREGTRPSRQRDRGGAVDTDGTGWVCVRGCSSEGVVT
jgi:hypothetical protein